MRIIAGEHRGRKLLAPEGDNTRPITDRAKQSLFDILTPQIEGAVVYDIFAGTGSMGLESLSRGAAHAMFFESDRSALRLLEQNIAALKVTDRATVVGTDLFKWFAQSKPPARAAGLIFLDPPYRYLNERPEELRKLAETLTTHMTPESLIIFRHDIGDSLDFSQLRVVDTRDYGAMRIEILRRKDQPQMNADKRE